MFCKKNLYTFDKINKFVRLMKRKWQLEHEYLDHKTNTKPKDLICMNDTAPQNNDL